MKIVEKNENFHPVSSSIDSLIPERKKCEKNVERKNKNVYNTRKLMCAILVFVFIDIFVYIIPYVNVHFCSFIKERKNKNGYFLFS